MERRYAIWDVFTARPLAGNPLAVVLDASGLTDEQMRAIAREFNLSETVFVLPAALAGPYRLHPHFYAIHGATVRGSSTVGAAIQLADDRIRGPRQTATP